MTEENKKEILKRIRRETKYKTNGQSTGNIPNGVTLVSDDCNIKIEVAFHRSQIKNFELAKILMELAIDSL